MTLLRRQFLHLTAGSLVAPALSSFALAQTYPARPVRVLVPYAPAGPADILARLAAQKLSDQFGKQFYVENVGGAGGNIGMGQGARAAADGYTVLVVPPNIVVNPAMYDTVPYDPYKDFDPVTVASARPRCCRSILRCRPDREGTRRADQGRTAGKYSFASPGTGTPPHLIGELFRLSLGLDLVHVPFNSGARRSARRWRATLRSLSRRCRRPCRRSRKASYVRSPSPARRDRRRFPTFRPWRRQATRRLRARVGSRSSFRPGRRRRSSRCLTARSSAHRAARHQGENGSARLYGGRQHAGGVGDVFRAESAKWSKVIREAGIKTN